MRCRYGESLQQGWALRRVKQEDIRSFLDQPPLPVDPLAMLAEEPGALAVQAAVADLLTLQHAGAGAAASVAPMTGVATH